MSTLVDEQPAAPEREPQADQAEKADHAATSNGPVDGPAGASASHPCPNCGAPMESGQEWCVQCGAAAPGALERSPWRSTGLIVAVIAALGLGAAAAAVAALNQHSPTQPTVTHIVAQAPTTAPPATTPVPATPPASTKTPVPKVPAKLPKVAATPTPIPPAPTATSTTPSGSTGGSQGSTSSGSEGSGEGSGSNSNQPSALLLDTDAASTYNPYNLPASFFGDPSLTIDGDHTTSWTAQVNPATAPSMAEGVLINLKSLKKLSALEHVSSSKGMVVQIYGTAETQAPASITDPGWVALTHPLAIKKSSTRFKLLKPKVGFRQLVVWISKAPPAAIGTPTAPGHVKVGEVEVFPAS